MVLIEMRGQVLFQLYLSPRQNYAHDLSNVSIFIFGSHFGGPFVVALSGLTLTGCLNDDNLIGENCYDEILNNGEELVDCGGPICDPCDPCENGEYDPLLGEQWVDCGGSCAPCDVHANGVLDEDAGEIGIDCGCDGCPACPELCGDGLLNGLEFQDNPNSIPDCGGPDCDPCPTCDDAIMNGDETGIDCGGSYCEPLRLRMRLHQRRPGRV